MQHSTPKIKKNKKLSIHFQKGFEEKERKKRSSQIESKNLFFFSTQLKRESDHFPLLSLSLHPFRLLSSTHTQGNKTFVTNEIRVSPSFSLFFRERSFHFHFPLLCAVIIMVGATFIWPGVRFSLYSTLTKKKDEATNNIQTTIPTTSFFPLEKRRRNKYRWIYCAA
jgi:hypothetical protein